MPADLKDQLAFLFAHKENALLRFYKYNKYTKHNSIPTKHLKIMFFDKVHTAVASGHGCGAQRPLCGLTATPI